MKENMAKTQAPCQPNSKRSFYYYQQESTMKVNFSLRLFCSKELCHHSI
jgi:hypothetical protein